MRPAKDEYIWDGFWITSAAPGCYIAEHRVERLAVHHDDGEFFSFSHNASQDARRNMKWWSIVGAFPGLHELLMVEEHSGKSPGTKVKQQDTLHDPWCFLKAETKDALTDLPYGSRNLGWRYRSDIIQNGGNEDYFNRLGELAKKNFTDVKLSFTRGGVPKNFFVPDVKIGMVMTKSRAEAMVKRRELGEGYTGNS